MKAVLQSEMAECGLASLAMVATHHGAHTDLPGLRRRFPLPLKGATLSWLADIAGRMGFRSRPLRLELEQLAQLRMPCILHWDLNHFVVLAKAGRARATILDPAVGRRRLTYADLSGHFTGVALELSPAAGFKRHKPAPAVSLRQLTGRITGLWRALAMILLLSLALQVFVVLGPFFLQWTVDQVLVSADRDLLAVLASGFALVLLLQVGIGLLRGWAVLYLSTRLGLEWVGNMFAHLLRLPLNFFEKRHLGDLVSRIGSVRAIQRTLTASFASALVDGLMAIVTFTMMLVYSRKLALITLAAVSLYLGVRALCFHALRGGTEQQLAAEARQQSHMLESIRGMQTIKVAGVEQQRGSRFANLMNDTANCDVWLGKLGLGFNGASGLIFGLERLAVIWTGALLVLDNVFSVGMLIAYLAYKDQFAGRIGGLIDKWIEFRMLRLHGERLADIALTEPEVQPDKTFRDAPLPDARIEVRGLGFRYADGEPWILRDCSFTVEEGEAVAIVGASGCGKTTLIKLLLGLLQPSAGRISVGGRDIAKLEPRRYRGILGAVMQDEQLFAGSVAENIALGDEGFDPRRAEAAARIAAVHDEIAAMPMGYDSLVGDMGTTLSGGQKQRVILARALYRKPRILFLDEATSHLDVQRERIVNDAVRRLRVTRVMIAHRPETVATADRVLVLRDGRIVQESGAEQVARPADAPGGATAAAA